MCKKIILLTSKKLYRQTEALAEAYIKELEYSSSVDEENSRLVDRIEELEDKNAKLDNELYELHERCLQLLDSNRSLEYVNDILEGKIEYYEKVYGKLEEEES